MAAVLSQRARRRLLEPLRRLYGAAAPAVLERIERRAARHSVSRRAETAAPWSERDVVLITYGDQVRAAGRAPLRALHAFLLDHGLDRVVSALHLLPFFPATSDEGFAVADYRRVDPLLGDWRDVAALGRSFDLMMDLVLNHCSRSHRWFRGYLTGRRPYRDYFVEADPEWDLSAVVRPRSTPLLTAVATRRGLRHVWTTFGDDQVDLDYRNPAVLLAMLDTLLLYVERGARIVRLDAIAYLWKRPGTSCIHLPETHLVVQVMRRLVEAVAPGTLLLTETNVPHAENVSYLGSGDEAHLVYQFSLPPLLLDAFIAGEARGLVSWLAGLEAAGPLPRGSTFVNFTASHDGIGLRPVEGLLPERRLTDLVAAVRERGGEVSTRRRPDGSDVPYELNVSWFSALAEPGAASAALQLRRFLASQALMLALQGIPAIYFHSLVGTANDRVGRARSGRARSLNRRRFERSELEAILAPPGSPERRVLDGMRHLLAVRRAQPAFHPGAEQRRIDAAHPAVVAFERRSRRPAQRLLVVANVAAEGVRTSLPGVEVDRWRSAGDLLGGRPTWTASGRLALGPCEQLWLARDGA